MVEFTNKMTVEDLQEQMVSVLNRTVNKFTGQKITKEFLLELEAVLANTLSRLFQAYQALPLFPIQFDVQVEDKNVSLMGLDRYSAVVMFYLLNDKASHAPTMPAVIEDEDPWPVRTPLGEVVGHLHWEEATKKIDFIPTEEKKVCKKKAKGKRKRPNLVNRISRKKRRRS